MGMLSAALHSIGLFIDWIQKCDRHGFGDCLQNTARLCYFEGQAKRTSESLDSIKSGYLLAMMGIFLLLASQFRSYIQPLIIMMAIPFGLIGAIGGHLVMGLAFTIISIFGIVALSGIVVNDSLILIDFTNRAHRGGMGVVEAVVESGRSRFRPVLLTSVTTIAGLFPLLLERSFQAQMLIPMAVSLGFGVLFATGVLGSAIAVAGFIVVIIAAGLSIGLKRTGQGWHDGMRFIQFYFALPLAMIIKRAFRGGQAWSSEPSSRYSRATRSWASVMFLMPSTCPGSA